MGRIGLKDLTHNEFIDNKSQVQIKAEGEPARKNGRKYIELADRCRRIKKYVGERFVD